MRTISTCIIEDNYFVTEGIKNFLEKSKYLLNIDFSSFDEIDSTSDREGCDLVILGMDLSPEEITLSVKALKTIFENSRIVIFSHRADAEYVLASFMAGAEGYLLKTISSEVFLASLDLIMKDQIVFPSLANNMLCAHYAELKNQKNGHTVDCFRLSDRELEIAKLLANGDSNKLIARHLDITEATVKVHLKAILRKLKLANRTQVAVWALNNGFSRFENFTYQEERIKA